MPSFADNHSGFVLPNARFNPAAQTPSCSGLLTPPESPKSGYAQLAMPKSTQFTAPTHEYRNLSPSSSLGSLEPEAQSAQHDLSRVSETIYTIIEQVIEQKLAEAMGPLRLNVRRLDSESLEFHEQNDALGKQNDALESQVRRLRCLEDQANAQLRTVQKISAITLSSLELISDIVAKLPDTNTFLQNAHVINEQQTTFRPASSASHQRQQHYHIQPQFCFESRTAKRHHQSHKKSKKPRLVNYMLSKWRTGGAGD
ncbi:uncharacterized protein BBA_05468 [Beauveria bassiana ARSEF 2860]|uniref:Uncharacterized protein n=1 Tax=Beauveria bassiana (strain ARSEF 2860) TaxID=655819 RepID=J4KNF2_BEAB2|nr:uncharacterized protein BBA_05468 [Beauveria bassiana ARSEF 2860]EJP65599.1 hypothetical protein BBA_05468 [Beauveria bassiana ARSEF 2860]